MKPIYCMHCIKYWVLKMKKAISDKKEGVRTYNVRVPIIPEWTGLFSALVYCPFFIVFILTHLGMYLHFKTICLVSYEWMLHGIIWFDFFFQWWTRLYFSKFCDIPFGFVIVPCDEHVSCIISDHRKHRIICILSTILQARDLSVV